MKAFILSVTIALSLLNCKGGWENESNGYVKTSIKNSAQTAGGAWVKSEKKATTEQLAAVEAGLTAAFNDARLSGYTALLDQHSYTVLFPVKDCVLSPVFQTLSFPLRADVYDGTIYDQYNPKGANVKDGIGVILAAEMVTQLSGEMIACPNSPDAVRNGAEHIIIYNNDSDYYARTWYHGDSVSHPLLPKRELKNEAREMLFSSGQIIEVVR
jgi:hypothetical protein